MLLLDNCPHRENPQGDNASCRLVILETGIDERQHETACKYCIDNYPLADRANGSPVLSACFRATKDPKYIPPPPKVLRPQACVHLGATLERPCLNCERSWVRHCNLLMVKVSQNAECETCPHYEEL